MASIVVLSYFFTVPMLKLKGILLSDALKTDVQKMSLGDRLPISLTSGNLRVPYVIVIGEASSGALAHAGTPQLTPVRECFHLIYILIF